MPSLRSRIRSKLAVEDDERMRAGEAVKVKTKILPCRLDVFAARLRAAKIPHFAHASDFGFGVTIKRAKRRDYEEDVARAWDIWQGTKEVA
jgi:hypothetical protein